MGLSARTDDFTGQPLGEGYLIASTSANNGLLFANPASRDAYVANNPGQFNKGTGGQTAADGDFNDTYQRPAES